MPSAIDNGNLPAEGERERGVTNEMGRGDRRQEEEGRHQGSLKLAANQSRTMGDRKLKQLSATKYLVH